MSRILKCLCLLAAFGLSACANPDRFGPGNDPSGGVNPAPVDPSLNGGVNDPTSPAYFSQTVGDRVLFLVDESTLNAGARQILDGQAGWLTTNSNFNILVEGHADEQGTREYNLALSAKRASAVQQYLVSRGVAPARIRTVPYGKERPIEICSLESCYAKNRRAVTVLNAGLSG